MNQQIRAPEVRLINDQGELIGVVSKSEALQMADEQDKDVILIAPNAAPPVAKLIQYSKFKYQQQQKKQEEKRSSKKSDIKELRLSPFIAEGDLESRIDRVREFLEDGFKVRLHVRFKGREITKKDFGEDVMTKVIVAVSDISAVEIPPKMQGKMMSAQLMPSGKK
jgi:translation initiation factor IF-3